MIAGLIENFIQRWQVKCPHEPRYVRADVLEGDVPGREVHWCYRCGAYKVSVYMTGMQTEWRQPKAAWARRAGL